jgi:hypothetical protein
MMKVIYILLMIAGPVIILEGSGVFTMACGMFLLLFSAVMLSMEHQPDINKYDKLEQAIDPHGVHIEKRNPLLILAAVSIMLSIVPAVWATAALSQEQWKIGSIILMVWSFPYWLLLNYLNKRSLLKVRLSFSLFITILVLAFTYVINK